MGSDAKNNSFNRSVRKTKVRRREGNKTPSRCSYCGFQSQRAYNVKRHESRIHALTTNQPKCCGLYHATKGDYYQHLVHNHPNKLSILVTKYKMRKDNAGNLKSDVTKHEEKAPAEITGGLKLFESVGNAKLKTEDSLLFDEDAPLIHSLREPPHPFTTNGTKFFTKTEENVKFEDSLYRPDSSCIKILIKGGPQSPVLAKIQSEFLSNIDFESLKLLLDFSHGLRDAKN